MSVAPPRPGAFVRSVVAGTTLPNPVTQVAIAVDTTYVAGEAGTNVSGGLYIMDNQFNDGSTGEGTDSLWTNCPVGSLIGYYAYPIDIACGDLAAVTGLSTVTGSVFGSVGAPIEINPEYWIGQAMSLRSKTYRV